MTWIFTALILILLYSKRLLSLSSRKISTRIEHFLPCIANITHHYNGDAGTDFLLLSEELNYPVPSDEIVRGIQHAVVIQRENQFKGYSGFFLLFPTKEKSYKSLLKIIRLSAYNKFLVVWPYETTSSDDNLIALINQFWSFRLLNVVILMRASTTSIRVYGYSPFTQPHCHVPRLVRLDVWSIPKKKFIYNNNLYAYYNSKFFNLNGCPLICFAKCRPPDSLVRQVGTEWQLDGVGGQLMKLLISRLNFTSIIRVPKADVPADKYGYDISPGIPELVTSLLVNQSIDLAFGIYSHIAYFFEGTEFPSSAVSECWCWAVPARSGKMIPTWMYYTGEFNINIWLLILSVYLASVFLIYLCSRVHYPVPVVFHQPTFAALHTLAILLHQPTASRIVFKSLPKITLMIALYSLIISSAYRSSMESLQTVPWKREHIKSFQEILDSNLQLVGPPQSGRLLKFGSEDNVTLQELSARFQIHRGFFEELIQRLQHKKNMATFAAQRFLQFYINQELNKTARDDVRIIPECVLQIHSSPFLLKRGSPFSHAIDWIVLVAVEAGLTQYWFTYSTPKEVPAPLSNEVHPLSMHKLTFVFLILLVGVSLSLLIFFVELLSFKNPVKKFTPQVRRLYNRTIQLLFVERYNLPV